MQASKSRLAVALVTYAILGALAFTTLEGKLRLVTLLVLVAFAVKTWIASVQQKSG
ncbi:MAG TPA: hypothetical protein VM120_19810 [Bryobacteraceae bacterium]|nr:hypothetical protein [Bryobacteraceae bacterium]